METTDASSEQKSDDATVGLPIPSVIGGLTKTKRNIFVNPNFINPGHGANYPNTTLAASDNSGLWPAPPRISPYCPNPGESASGVSPDMNIHFPSQRSFQNQSGFMHTGLPPNCGPLPSPALQRPPMCGQQPSGPPPTGGNFAPFNPLNGPTSFSSFPPFGHFPTGSLPLNAPPMPISMSHQAPQMYVPAQSGGPPNMSMPPPMHPCPPTYGNLPPWPLGPPPGYPVQTHASTSVTIKSETVGPPINSWPNSQASVGRDEIPGMRKLNSGLQYQCSTKHGHSGIENDRWTAGLHSQSRDNNSRNFGDRQPPSDFKRDQTFADDWQINGKRRIDDNERKLENRASERYEGYRTDTNWDRQDTDYKRRRMDAGRNWQGSQSRNNHLDSHSPRRLDTEIFSRHRANDDQRERRDTSSRKEYRYVEPRNKSTKTEPRSLSKDHETSTKHSGRQSIESLKSDIEESRKLAKDGNRLKDQKRLDKDPQYREHKDSCESEKGRNFNPRSTDREARLDSAETTNHSRDFKKSNNRESVTSATPASLHHHASSRSYSRLPSVDSDSRSSSRAESGYHSSSKLGNSSNHRPSTSNVRDASSRRECSERSHRSKSRESSEQDRRSESRMSHSRESSFSRSNGLDRYGRKIQKPSGRLLHRDFRQSTVQSPDERASKDAGSSDDEDDQTRTLREFLTTQSVKLGEKTLNACLNFDTQSHHQDESEDSEVDDVEEEKILWLRCSPADLYYQRSDAVTDTMVGTAKLATLLDRFKHELVDRSSIVRKSRPPYEVPPRKEKKYPLPTAIAHPSDSEEMSEDESSDDDTTEKEMERKRLHPDRLHDELWFNEPGEMNDGPACRCSARARSCGIRHGIYPGEDPLPPCDPNSNNMNRLYHYRVTMSPHINFLTKLPTIITHDGHEFIFEGFSMFSHYSLTKLPTCKVIRFNIEYTIHYIEEKFPEHFTIRELDLFYDYLYREILELVDLNIKAYGDTDGCKRFHFLPRFVRTLEHNGKEVLSMNEVLAYLLDSSRLLLADKDIPELMKMKQYEWQNYADQVKGQIVTFPGKRPCSLRVDQLDRDLASSEKNIYPEIIHFGIRPLQLSYAGNPTYRKSWHEYVKFRHLLANKPKVTTMDRHKLMQRETELQDMRTKTALKRDVTVVIGSRGFYRTGIMCDMTQHALLLPVLVSHLRFHKSMDVLEDIIDYKFANRHLLQLAMTHPSFRENFGTNPDHARNSLTNCGIRQPVYGDRRIHYVNTRKRGINTLITIMAKFGKDLESYSNIKHNERLEFLGDAVVEFHSSIHLYHLFPELEEGGLATYRAAIVQNQHLAVLAKRLQLDRFMLYAHGSDLCHDLELRHAMANCFEAVMGALFIDAGVDVVDRIFSKTLFPDPVLHDVWINYAAHPLQEQEPNGDRQWVESVPLLKKLRQFELDIGIDFTHIRLLARAFTHRSVGFNNLTLGSNQRMEFLGDTILQLIASEYLYRHFPEHHEGHLSLLRSSLVNNRTQAVVCDDLGMVEYVIYAYANPVLKIKDKADLLEAFVGALFVDKGLDYCKTFCHVCFFPRLRMFIMNQDWNDPKSKLQQCCLTLRTMEGGEPDIPIYKVIECKGPTNTRVFTVAVYFRGQRLAKGTGHSIQRAEMAAAKKALESHEAKTWPQLKFQRKVIQKSIHMDKIMQAANQPKVKEEPVSAGPADQNKISLWVDQ